MKNFTKQAEEAKKKITTAHDLTTAELTILIDLFMSCGAKPSDELIHTIETVYLSGFNNGYKQAAKEYAPPTTPTTHK